MDGLPFSQACENNKSFILDILKGAFANCDRVLEIASGTGQHACHFARHMPWLLWQPTELPENLGFLRTRCESYEGANLLTPLALDVRETDWPVVVPAGIFTANSLHIMAMAAVRDFFHALGSRSPVGAVLAVYGPFNYAGEYTSDSNERFDQWLAQQSPDSAIRNFEDLDELAAAAGLVLSMDCEMPANNRLLVWRKG